jgi:hypothetical protein
MFTPVAHSDETRYWITQQELRIAKSLETQSVHVQKPVNRRAGPCQGLGPSVTEPVGAVRDGPCRAVFIFDTFTGKSLARCHTRTAAARGPFPSQCSASRVFTGSVRIRGPSGNRGRPALAGQPPTQYKSHAATGSLAAAMIRVS